MSNGGNDSGQPSPLGDAYADASTPDRFTAWIRDRTIGTRCTLTIHGAPATITSASTNTTIDANGEHRCWKQLRAAVQTALNGDTITAAAKLPPEIAAAEWVHHGKRTRIHQPGAATRALRCARRGLKAFTPLPPLLGALSQPLAGGATAIGILVVPIPFNAPTDPPPISMPAAGLPSSGDITRPAPDRTTNAHPTTTPAVGPGAPLLPALLPRSTLFPAAGDSAQQDTAPTPAPVYTPPPATRRTAPTPSPTSTSAPTSAPPAPGPSITDLLDAASPSPSPTPPGPPEPKPTVSQSPTITRMVRHLQQRHHEHPLRRIHRLG